MKKQLFALTLLGLISLTGCKDGVRYFEGLQSSDSSYKIMQLARNEQGSFEVPIYSYEFRDGEDVVYTGKFKEQSELDISYFTLSGSLKGLTPTVVKYEAEDLVTLTLEGKIESKNATEGYINVSLKAFKEVAKKYQNYTYYICKVAIGDETGEVDRS